MAAGLLTNLGYLDKPSQWRLIEPLGIEGTHPMANTVWKGQLTFGLVSFPVRLVRAARKERIPLRYMREVESSRDESDRRRAHRRDEGRSAEGNRSRQMLC